MTFFSNNLFSQAIRSFLADHPEITQVTSSSQQVQEGTLFVAIQGEKKDGNEFISDAVQRGASWIFSEKTLPLPRFTQVPDARLALSLSAAELAGHPSQALLMIGITGTSGKTTTSYLIESILKKSGHRVGVIGSIENRIDQKKIPSSLTTPGAVEIQTLLSEMKKNQCTAVVMEVSSHALVQHRIAGIAFDRIIFTNLSSEHLDYHPHMEAYFKAKKILFFDQVDRSQQMGKKPVAIIHHDGAWGTRLMDELKKNSPKDLIVRPFTLSQTIQINSNGIHGSFSGIQIQSPLLARFNAENIAAAVELGCSLNLAPSKIQKGIYDLTFVPGRLERVRDPIKKRMLLVDYAHKPDALKKVLTTLQSLKAPHQKLITVFGCGGDRDRTKRPLMGLIGADLSDQLIITSDNPRSEDPQKIVDEIIAPLLVETPPRKHWFVEVDREKAIQKALSFSRDEDIVLIAGKGHEDYQIIGSQTFHFDDREVLQKYLKSS